jgi:hypothetical protein
MPPIAACSVDAKAITSAVTILTNPNWPPIKALIQVLSTNEPRKVPIMVVAPLIYIAATAMPAGRKTAVAYPGGTASRRPSLPVMTYAINKVSQVTGRPGVAIEKSSPE